MLIYAYKRQNDVWGRFDFFPFLGQKKRIPEGDNYIKHIATGQKYWRDTCKICKNRLRVPRSPSTISGKNNSVKQIEH